CRALAGDLRRSFNQDIPGFPHNKRSKNERLPLLHFAFFLLHFAFRTLPLFLSLSFGAQKKVTTPLVHRTKLTRAYASVPKIALHSVAQNKLALSAWHLPGYL
ncbi:MAG: hypothetical protein KDE26_25250, partial [Bacteroidetes bacterium]|nr:hypothetical protein [Bacteroidota bacterium]